MRTKTGITFLTIAVLALGSAPIIYKTYSHGGKCSAARKANLKDCLEANYHSLDEMEKGLTDYGFRKIQRPEAMTVRYIYRSLIDSSWGIVVSVHLTDKGTISEIEVR